MKIPCVVHYFFLNFDCNKILYSYNLYTCIIMIIEKKNSNNLKYKNLTQNKGIWDAL